MGCVIESFHSAQVARKQLLLHVGGDFELRFAPPLGIGLLANGCHNAVVVPGLLNEVAGAASHGLHGKIDIAPGGHHDHRRGVALRVQAGQQIEAFFAGGRVARVVEIGQDEVERFGARGSQQVARRFYGDGLPALSFEQQAHGFEYVHLIVTNQDPEGLGLGRRNG